MISTVKIYAKDKTFNGMEQEVEFINGMAEVPAEDTDLIAHFKSLGYTIGELPPTPVRPDYSAQPQRASQPVNPVNPVNPIKPEKGIGKK